VQRGKTADAWSAFTGSLSNLACFETTEGTRIYGAGILSSPKEILHALSDKVERLPFDPAVVCETEYDVWHMQDKLFVIESFEKLENDFSAWVEEMEMR
jgi:phenylalanine-4-hydroxylase